jgi:hypothetical protein
MECTQMQTAKSGHVWIDPAPYKEKVANTGARAASMEAMIRSPSAPHARLQSRVTGRILQLSAVRPSLEKGELLGYSTGQSTN